VVVLRVAVVAEDPLARGGLAALVEGEGLSVVTQVAPADAGALADLDAAAVDLLTDGALEALPAIAAPTVALLAADAQAPDALAAGARGVVSRGAPGPRIAAALTAVAHGLVAVDAALGPEVLRPRPQRRARGVDDLTPREAEVLALLAEGLPNKEIARRLGIAERTAKFHVEAILGKLGVESRAEAIVRAARLGLVTL
jgi:DNA-binding NarL/FixJ family response regulator